MLQGKGHYLQGNHAEALDYFGRCQLYPIILPRRSCKGKPRWQIIYFQGSNELPSPQPGVCEFREESQVLFNWTWLNNHSLGFIEPNLIRQPYCELPSPQNRGGQWWSSRQTPGRPDKGPALLGEGGKVLWPEWLRVCLWAIAEGELPPLFLGWGVIL